MQPEPASRSRLIWMRSWQDISVYPVQHKERSVPRWEAAPSIIAEALVAVPDALLTALQPGAPASAASVAARLAQSLSPAEDRAEPPAWLLGPQVSSFRRVLAAIHRFRGSLLADPVGSGKTFVALAVAAQLNRGP